MWISSAKDVREITESAMNEQMHLSEIQTIHGCLEILVKMTQKNNVNTITELVERNAYSWDFVQYKTLPLF